MVRECDNQSVGVIIRDTEGQYALLRKRTLLRSAKVSIGIAPPASHIDEYGSPEQAVFNTVKKELGLYLAMKGLQRTAIYYRQLGDACGRRRGDHHMWNVFESEVPAGSQLRPGRGQAKDAAWYSPQAVQALADRTKAFRAGAVSEASWKAEPGLEELWLDFMVELEHVQ